MVKQLSGQSHIPSTGRPKNALVGRVPVTRFRAQAEVDVYWNARQVEPEETLIVDARANLRPAQMVERKLVGLLKSVLLPVSHMQHTAVGRSRCHC